MSSLDGARSLLKKLNLGEPQVTGPISNRTYPV